MLRATMIIRRADLGRRICVDTVTLDRAARWRRRVAMTSDRGHAFLLDLPEAASMADGDALELEDGTLIRVLAAAEPLLEVHAHDAAALARIAWHIGNRHTPCEVTADALYIQPDHVLGEMIAGLGGHVHAVSRPFEPEGGAYGGHKGGLAGGHHHHGHEAGGSHGHAAHGEHAHGHHHHGTDGQHGTAGSHTANGR
jgi:urease accessory protein